MSEDFDYDATPYPEQIAKRGCSGPDLPGESYHDGYHRLEAEVRRLTVLCGAHVADAANYKSIAAELAGMLELFYRREHEVIGSAESPFAVDEGLCKETEAALGKWKEMQKEPAMTEEELSAIDETLKEFTYTAPECMPRYARHTSQLLAEVRRLRVIAAELAGELRKHGGDQWATAQTTLAKWKEMTDDSVPETTT